MILSSARVALLILAAALSLAAQDPTAQPPKNSQSQSATAPTHKVPKGGVEILSDTQGVDFGPWLGRWRFETAKRWNRLMPNEVNPPELKKGLVIIRFKVLPNGQVTDMSLDGRSGDTGLDRAAWGAITGSSYPALPREFHGPYLELRAYFLYNMEPR